MKIEHISGGRRFRVGLDADITINHVANVRLNPNEQLTFQHPSEGEYDFVCKDWGFYASPSLNHRLRNEGFSSFLVRNDQGRVYLMVVKDSARKEFYKYCSKERQEIISDLSEQ